MGHTVDMEHLVVFMSLTSNQATGRKHCNDAEIERNKKKKRGGNTKPAQQILMHNSFNDRDSLLNVLNFKSFFIFTALHRSSRNAAF